MAGRAGSGGVIRFESNLPRFMNRVALEAGFERLVGEMRLVAFETGRNASMPFAVAVLTPLPGMLAREIFQLRSRLLVAFCAFSGQNLQRETPNRGMRVFVTGKAIRLFITMRQVMAIPALWHQLGIILLTRVVDVKNGVTFPAVEAVGATLSF